MLKLWQLIAFGSLVLAGTACAQKAQTTTSTTTTTTEQSADTAASAPGSASAHDPCALLTTADVAAVIKKPVETAQHVDDTHCMYKPKNSVGGIILEAAWSGADAQFAGGVQANSMMGDQEKSAKVGDASYSTAMGNVYYARKGDAYVGVDMRAAAVPVETVGPALATKALARM